MATRYSRDHLWVREHDGEVTMGVTGQLRLLMGPISIFEMDEVAPSFASGDVLARCYSSGSVGNVIAPCAGTLVARNAMLLHDPSALNHDPEGAGWIVRFVAHDAHAFDEFLDERAYRALIA